MKKVYEELSVSVKHLENILFDVKIIMQVSEAVIHLRLGG